MNTEQMKLFRDIYSKEAVRPDTGEKTTNGEYIRFCLDNNIDFVTSKDFVLYDDDNTLVHCIAVNDAIRGKDVFPVKIISADYSMVQYIETVMSKIEFLKFIDSEYLGKLLKGNQAEMLKKFTNSIPTNPIQSNKKGAFYRDDDFINGDVLKPIEKEDMPKPELETVYSFSSISDYSTQAATGSLDGKTVILNISDTTFNSELGLPNMQNNPNPPKLALNISNCIFDGAGSTKAQIYLTNSSRVHIDNCIFKNSGENSTPIHINHTAIKDAMIIISNCTFEDTSVKSCIQVAARLGDTDHPAGGDGVEGTIKAVSVTGCSFPEGVLGFIIGVGPEGEDTTANTSTGNYGLLVTENDTDITIKNLSSYDKGIDAPVITVKVGETYKQMKN